MTTKAWNRNQRWVWRNGTQISMWNILGQTTSCCLQSFFLPKQPKKLCSIGGNSQSCWMLLVRKAHKIPLRKLDYSAPIFNYVFTIFDVAALVQQNLNWVSCHVECWNSPFNINTFTFGFVHCLFQGGPCPLHLRYQKTNRDVIGSKKCKERLKRLWWNF